MNKTVIPFITSEKLTFVPARHKAPAFLRGWLLRLRDWLNAFEDIKTVGYETVTFDFTPLVDDIFRMIQAVESRGHKAKYLIVGRKAYFELTLKLKQQVDFNHFNFNIQSNRYGDLSPFGLVVVVVPWVDGWFILPELE